MQTSCASLLISLLSCTFAAPAPTDWNPHDCSAARTVDTTSGTVIGHVAPDRPDVDEYLGIHYATAQRFALPVRCHSDKTYNASTFAQECPAIKAPNGTLPGQPYTRTEPSIIGHFLEQVDTNQGEDCLAVNVWSKRSSNKKKPVLLWAYGGRFETGYTNTPFYQGQYLASQEDLVVITYNYRFGIFGFPGIDSDAQNVGLLDSRMALEWVRDNAAAFGGDPEKITFAGHSAGAFVIDYLAYAFPHDPIMAGMILQSGTALTIPSNTPEETLSSFHNVSATLGCLENSTDTLLACMRSKEWKEVLKAAALPAAGLHTAFEPTIDNKTIWSTTQYEAKASKGEFARVPRLVGNANYEAGFYKIQFAAHKEYLNETAWAGINARLATCPAAVTSDLLVAQHIPTWRYRYFGEFPSLTLYHANANGTSFGSGAYHGSELTPLWGTSELVTGVRSSPELLEMSAYLMKAWATFARDPRKGLEAELGWPLYETEGASLISLGRNSSNGARIGDSTEFDHLGSHPCKVVLMAGES